MDINGSFTINTGSTVVAPPGMMNVRSSFTVNSGGVFNPNGGSVVLDGVNQVITGNVTFHNLVKKSVEPSTLTFSSGSTQTIEGDLTLQGTSSDPLNLASSTPGSSWNIDAQGSKNLRYLSVQDSNNIGITSMQAYDSQDLGNNINWEFLATPALTPNTSIGTVDNSSKFLPATGDNTLEILAAIGLLVVVTSIGLYGAIKLRSSL